MRHTSQKYARPGKVRHLLKCATLGKMRDISKNAPDLENAPNLEKLATVPENLRHNWNDAPHLEQCSKLGKMSHIWRNEPHLRKCYKCTQLK